MSRTTFSRLGQLLTVLVLAISACAPSATPAVNPPLPQPPIAASVPINPADTSIMAVLEDPNTSNIIFNTTGTMAFITTGHSKGYFYTSENGLSPLPDWATIDDSDSSPVFTSNNIVSFWDTKYGACYSWTGDDSGTICHDALPVVPETLTFSTTTNSFLYETEDGKLNLLEVNSGVLTELGAGRTPMISPNDNLVAATVNRDSIVIYDLQNHFQLTAFPGNNPVWTPDNTLIFSRGPDQAVWIYNSTSNTQSPTVCATKSSGFAALWDNHFAYGTPKGIWICDAITGNTRKVSDLVGKVVGAFHDNPVIRTSNGHFTVIFVP